MAAVNPVAYQVVMMTLVVLLNIVKMVSTHCIQGLVILSEWISIYMCL